MTLGKFVDWKVAGSIVVGAYLVAILSAFPAISPSGIAAKIGPKA